jgi:hypothetical protein
LKKLGVDPDNGADSLEKPFIPMLAGVPFPYVYQRVNPPSAARSALDKPMEMEKGSSSE